MRVIVSQIPGQRPPREARNTIYKVMRRGIKRGEFRKVNLKVLANVILGGVEGANMLWVVDPEKTPAEAVANEIEDLITYYLMKK